MDDRVRAILAPASIAIVGASDDPDRIGGRPVRILQARGYRGRIFPVNPKYATVQGLPCYPDIASLPAAVELYVIALPAAGAVDAVAQAAEHGARAVVLFSAGFAETGAAGRALQDRLSAIVARHGLALLGPNALGAASFVHRAFPTFATALETLPQIEPGRIALLSQSGGFGFNLFTEAYWAGARFSHVITTGNEAGLTFADGLAYLAGDPETDAILGYLEGVRDGDRFRASLERLRRAGKPLFVIKAGTSARGSAGAASHTAQLSGYDRAFDATFHRYGVTRLTTLDEAVDVARAWPGHGAHGAHAGHAGHEGHGGHAAHAATTGLAIVTNSGGTAVYLADACERYGLTPAPLTGRTRDRLRRVLPAFAGLANPIDITAQIINDRSLLGATLEVVDQDETVERILLFLGSMEYLADELIDRLLAIRASLAKPLFVSWAGIGDRTRARAAERGLPLCADPARVVRGLGLVRAGAAALGSAPGAPADAPDALQDPSATSAVAPSGRLAARPVPGGRLALDEWQTMALLERYGARGPRRMRARTADEAAAAAARLGYPCVLKLLEPLLPHRALAGAVVTGIGDETALRAAFARLRREHDAQVCLVAEALPAGVELIAGALADATFGTRAVLGPGGVWVHDGQEVETLVPPYDDAYVAGALGRLGGAPVDPDRLGAGVATVLRALAAAIAAGHGRITEIECNPLLVTESGVVMLDALAFVDPEHADVGHAGHAGRRAPPDAP